MRAPSGGAWPAGQWAAQRQAEARGGLEYLLTVGAPAGVIMLFALVAFALGRQVRGQGQGLSPAFLVRPYLIIVCRPDQSRRREG